MARPHHHHRAGGHARTLLLLPALVVALLVRGGGAQVSSRSPSPSITRSPSYTPTASLTPSITPSMSFTPSFTASVTVTPTPTAFACPVQVTGAVGAGAPRPGVGAGVVECGGQGSCVRDGSVARGGRCVCAGLWEGGGGGCESCPLGLYQAATCAVCASGGGPCRRSSDGACAALEPVAGGCPSGYAACADTNRSAPGLRTLTCAACPGLTVSVNASGATVRSPCSGHGACNQYDGACYCAAGWRGANCSTPVPPTTSDPCDGVTCSGVGLCVGGSCTCMPGYTGASCQYRTPVPVTYFWATSAWSACSRDCGSGAMQRTAACMQARNDVLQNNFTVAPAASATLCSSFTRPALAADCRTLTCGGTVATFFLQFAANTSLLTLSDTLDAALGAAVVAEVAAYLRATAFPQAALDYLTARLQVLGVTPATAIDPAARADATLLHLEWLSSNTHAPDGLDLSSTAFVTALTAGVASNATALRSSATYMRALLPLTPLLAATLAGTNESVPQSGLLFANLSSSPALTPASNSFFVDLTVGQLIGFAFGVAGAIVLLGCLVFLVWRWSLRSASTVGVWTGRDRRGVKDDDASAAVVVRPDGAGGLQIVRSRNDLPATDSFTGGGPGLGPRRASGAGMGERRASGAGLGERRASGAGAGMVGMGERRASGAGFRAEASPPGMGPRRASAAGVAAAGTPSGGVGPRRMSAAGLAVMAASGTPAGMGGRRISASGMVVDGGGAGGARRLPSGVFSPSGGELAGEGAGMGGRRTSAAALAGATAARDQPEWVRGGRTDWMSATDRRVSFVGVVPTDDAPAAPTTTPMRRASMQRLAEGSPGTAASTLSPSGVAVPITSPPRAPSFSPGTHDGVSPAAPRTLPPVVRGGGGVGGGSAADMRKVNDVRTALISAAAAAPAPGAAPFRHSGPLAAAALAEADARVSGMYGAM